MPVKRRRSHKIRKGFLRILGGIILLYLLVSISPSNSVRMTMAISGHPKSALQCSPRHDAGLSKGMQADIYTIQDRYGYNRLGMRHVVLFHIHRFWVFHAATATYRYF